MRNKYELYRLKTVFFEKLKLYLCKVLTLIKMSMTKRE
jgi:hypothetical protein